MYACGDGSRPSGLVMAGTVTSGNPTIGVYVVSGQSVAVTP